MTDDPKAGAGRITLVNGVIVTLLVGAVSWATARIIETGEAANANRAAMAASADARVQLIAARNRETDDIKARLAALEARNCP